MFLRAIMILFSALFHAKAFHTPVKKINLLRREIDTIDDKISCLIETRMMKAKKIGTLKNKNEIDDPLREEQIRKRIKKRHPTLPPELVDDVWRLIFVFSKRAQRNG